MELSGAMIRPKIMRFSATRTLLLSLAVVIPVSAACGGGQPKTIAAPTPSATPAPPSSASAVAIVVEPPPAPLIAQGPMTPPMTLTASDGTGLRLMRLVGRSVVDDPLAFTELTLTFENPSERTLEGTFAITLPQGAAVSRFAMKMPDGTQEGEVVELEEARRAYEDFLHRKQDPALLEQGAGNQFTARVFPIPARAQKEITISYSQETTADAPFALPLRGLPEIGEIDLEIATAGSTAPAAVLKQRSYTPTGDAGIDARLVRHRAGIRSGNLALARVRPVAAAQPEPLTSALVLVDTSASRALGFDAELAAVSAIAKLAAKSEGGARLVVAAFDQTTEPIYSGDASAFGDEAIAKLRDHQALGASNLEAALAWAKSNAAGSKRVILVTDGVATAGATEGEKLDAMARGLKEAGVERIDAVAIGGIRDDATLKHLATAGLAKDGVVVDGSLDLATVERRLSQATRSGIEVKVDDASFVWPRRLDGVQPGDETLVYADVPDGKPFRVSLGGAQSVAIEADVVERPLLERAWVKAKIASLMDAQRATGETPERKKEIISLSLANRVLTPYTALLVLETDEDYDRFKIDRRALVDVMTVDRGKVALMKRNGIHRNAPTPIVVQKTPEPAQPSASASFRDGQPPPPPPASGPAPRPASPPSPMPAPTATARADTPAPPPAAEDAKVGLGGVGSASGASMAPAPIAPRGAVGGSGSGIGLGGHRITQAPQLREGATQVNGRLPPEVIRRIVRQNFGRFRLCYVNGLRTNPRLSGRVSVRFVIDRSGGVSTAQDAGSTMADRNVVSCVVRGFGNLSFPQPEGGIVVVVYPITFSPSDGPTPQPPRDEDQGEAPAQADPYTGSFKTVMDAIAAGKPGVALDRAEAWRKESPGDVLALVALGEAYEASKDPARASRAYGSIVDLFPSRADMRRFAGVRLERVAGGLDLALDTFEKAAAQRPDHPHSYRLVAYAHLKKNEYDKAFDAIVSARKWPYGDDRFPGVDKILREDLGIIAAAWIKAEPKRAAEIAQMREAHGGVVEDKPSLRFVLNWETDANDVDFHIYDAKGGHAFYSQKHLPSGGDLYADITTGYGPECFTIRLPRAARSAKYTLQANYYSRGPMGYGMGKLEIIDHDGHGGVTIEERPYVVMTDQAFVDLGAVKR
jgi:tetratricopeptide (TPR) repeat protein